MMPRPMRKKVAPAGSIKLKLRKGDRVEVITGRDKGKQGEIIKSFPRVGRVIVSGVNRVKRHVKPQSGKIGGITEKEMSIHVSNVAVIDPKLNKPTRVGYQFLTDGRKVRFARRSGEIIDDN